MYDTEESQNKQVAPQLIEYLQAATYDQAESLYKSLHLMPTIDNWLLQYLGKHDRFFLLTRILRRPDANHPWLYERTREVEADPYNRLDLWARGHYKLLANTTPVSTPTGTRLHGDLKAGDYVFSPEGKPVKILATTGELNDPEMYHITFSDHNRGLETEIHAGADHLWDVEYKSRQRATGTEKRIGWVGLQMSTKELVGYTDRQKGSRNPVWYRVKASEAKHYPKKELLVPPYTLGAWLGDGTSSTGQVTNRDDQLWGRVEAEGFTLSHDQDPRDCTQRRTIFGLTPSLRALGLLGGTSGTKFIPEEYQTSSLPQRTALIQGLMDTDGSVTDRGDFVYTTISPQLALDVSELLGSLGVQAGVNPYTFLKEGEDYVYYKVQFVPCAEVEFFSLDYHKERIREKKPVISDRYWYIKDISPAKSGPSQCIQVEGGRYVAGEYDIPTHNSTIITFAGTIQEILRNPEVTIGIFSCTRPIAKAFLQQIQMEAEGNEMLYQLWPEIFWGKNEKPGVWGLDSGLVFKRKGNPKEKTVEAWGIVDGQPTSKHFDILLYDDVVTAEYVGTPEMIKKTTDRLELSFNLGTPHSKGGREIYAGTRYAYGDTYQTLKDRGVVSLREYPATHDGTFDGKPVLLTQKEWDKIKNGTSRFTVACQQLLNPIAGSEQTFDPHHLRMYEVRPRTLNVYIMCDPANSKKKGSDRSAFAVVGIDSGYNKYLLDGACHRMTLSERWEFLKMLRTKWLRQPGVQLVKVGYEKYGMQTDIEHFNEMMKLDQEYFEIIELSWTKDGQQSKGDRVQRLQPDFENWSFFLPYSYTLACLIADLNEMERPDERSKGVLSATQQKVFHDEGPARISKPIRRVDEEDKAYDISEFFINNEFMLFPSIHPDFMDALSRIYDIEITAPQSVSQEILEPSPEAEY